MNQHLSIRHMLPAIALLFLLAAIQPAGAVAIRFNGTGYVEIPTAASGAYNFTTDSFTLEAWIYPDYFNRSSNDDEHTIIGNDAGGSTTGAGYVLRTGGRRALEFSFFNGTTWVSVRSPAATLVAGNWQHVAVTKAGGRIALYVDGKAVAGASLNSGYDIVLSTNPLRFAENGNRLYRTFYGGIHEVKIWRTERSAAEVRADGRSCCGIYPPGLLGYYPLQDGGTGDVNPISCANNPAADGMIYQRINHFSGPTLFPGGTTDLYVDSSLTTGPACLRTGYSWATAFSHLSTALGVAFQNPQIERIHVAQGTYVPQTTRFFMDATRTGRGGGVTANSRENVFHLRSGLEVYGGYPAGGGSPDPGRFRTILDGGELPGMTYTGSYHVVYMDSSVFWARTGDTTKLSGFTIRNGNADINATQTNSSSDGSGILTDSGTHFVADCSILNNTGAYAGAISSFSRLILLRDTISNNNNGIILFDKTRIDGQTLVRSCVLTDNNSCAVQSSQSNLRITGNVIRGNLGDVGTGAISMSGIDALIDSNIITRNTGHGIYIQGGNRISIIGNEISDHNVQVLGSGGGAIYLYSVNARIEGNKLLRDTAVLGGGVYAFNSQVTFNSNLVEDNTASSDGGGLDGSGGTYNLYNNHFIHNKAGTIGGGAFLSGRGTADNNVFASNTAVFAGGLELFGQYQASNNLFASNSAGQHGGLFSYGSAPATRIVNNTFFNNCMGNSALGGGAALTTWYNNIVQNNVFWGNRYDNSGMVRGADYSNAQGNSLLQSNAMQLPDSMYTTGTGGMYDLGAAASGNTFHTDPQFADTSNPAGPDGLFGTGDDGLQLLAGSPFLDAGQNSYLSALPDKDLRLKPRIYGRSVDLGAYELGCEPGNITPLSNRKVCKGESASLRVNTGAAPGAIEWYASGTGGAALDTGYWFNTPALKNTDTFWVAVAGCGAGTRMPVTVRVPSLPISRTANTLRTDSTALSIQWLQCNPYLQIPGETRPDFQASQNGSYAVTATIDGCRDTSGCETVSGLGLAAIQPVGALQIIPNPARGFIRLTTPLLRAKGTLSIFNTTGRELSRLPTGDTAEYSLDLQQYPAGIYYLQLDTESGRYIGKLLKL